MTLILGPYVGSFKQEILTFRPYITWIHKVLQPDKTYVSTHFNRSFLYKTFDNELLPVYKQLSRDELGQEGYIHRLLSLKNYNIFVKDLKITISEKEECSKKDIDVMGINYTKSVIQYPIYNKTFEHIDLKNINTPDELKNLRIFIPYGDEDEMSIFYNSIKDKGFVVVGDMNTPLVKENKIFKYIDYFENGWEYIIGAISYAKVVVCPLSYWTTICNLQKVPVFSWGNNPGQYREGGMYHFDNKEAMILPNIGNITGYLNNFINGV